ncbi:MAG: hypothetical protein ACFFFC_18625, partial [Candidatus Thorarchaeota archaeon]
MAIIFTILLYFLKIDVCNASKTELSQSGPSTISLRAGWHPQFYRIVLEGDEDIVSKGHVKQNEKDITISFDNARIDVERKYTPFAYKGNSDGVVVSLPKKGKMKVYSLSGPSRLVVDVYPLRSEQKPRLTKRRHKAKISGSEQNKAVGQEDADIELSEGKQILAHQRAMEDDRFKVVEKTDAEGDT